MEEHHHQRTKLAGSGQPWQIVPVLVGLSLLLTMLLVTQTAEPVRPIPTTTTHTEASASPNRSSLATTTVQSPTTLIGSTATIEPIVLTMPNVPNTMDQALAAATNPAASPSLSTLGVTAARETQNPPDSTKQPTPTAQTINPSVSSDLQTATTLAQRPTAHPTILPASPQFIGLISVTMDGKGVQIQQIDTNRQAYRVADHMVISVPRHNQPPVLLQQPEANILQITDSMTGRSFQWQFEEPIEVSDFEIVLSSNQQQLLIKTQHDLLPTDQFNGAIQLATINLQTGELQVLADSLAWAELRWVTLIAWQGDRVYLFNQEKITRDLWRLRLTPSLEAEKIAEIPLTIGSDTTTQTYYRGQVVAAPNQRWLLYSLPHPKGMLVRVLDLTTETYVELEMPLMELEQLSFAPHGNSFAIMLPEATSSKVYPALYQLDTQRWFRLDASVEYAPSFKWSNNGEWLLYRTPANQLNVYNTLDPSLAIKAALTASVYPVAILNDGKTILVRHIEDDRLEQYTWNSQQWQLEWRIDHTTVSDFNLLFVYPR